MKKKIKEDYSYTTTINNTSYEGLLLNAEYFDMIKDPVKRTYLIDYTYELGESFVIEQLLKGAEIEKEHTDKFDVALQIAVDHLIESIYYYIELEKMESKLRIMESVSLEEGINFDKYYDPMFGATDEFFKSPEKNFYYPESVKSFVKDFSCSWLLDTLDKHWYDIKGFKDFCLIFIEKQKNTFILKVVDYPGSKSPIYKEDLGFTSLPFNVMFYLIDGILLFPSDYFTGE